MPSSVKSFEHSFTRRAALERGLARAIAIQKDIVQQVYITQLHYSNMILISSNILLLSPLPGVLVIEFRLMIKQWGIDDKAMGYRERREACGLPRSLSC